MINKKKYIDVSSGKMTLEQLSKEIYNYMLWKNPQEMIITIKRDDNIGGYRSIIYLTKEDFEKYKW